MVNAIAAPQGTGLAALAGMGSSARGSTAGDKAAVSPSVAHEAKIGEPDERVENHGKWYR
jgi:hypothetical protein